MNSLEVRMVGNLITAVIYLLSPILIWWGARRATRVPGWKGLVVLLGMSGIGRFVGIFTVYHPGVLAYWSMITSAVGICTLIYLWKTLKIRSFRFKDLPKDAAIEYIDRIPFAACIVGEDGRALAINEKYEKTMGVTIEDIRKKGEWITHVDAHDRKRVTSAWKDFFERRSDNYDETFSWNHPVEGPIRIRARGYVNGKRTFCSVTNVSILDTVESLKKTVRSMR